MAIPSDVKKTNPYPMSRTYRKEATVTMVATTNSAKTKPLKGLKIGAFKRKHPTTHIGLATLLTLTTDITIFSILLILVAENKNTTSVHIV